MYTVLTYYMKKFEVKEKDDNAFFVVIIPKDKAETVKAIIENELKILDESMVVDFDELFYRYHLLDMISNETPCRMLPQRTHTIDGIYTLELVTEDFYFYFCENDEYPFMCRTQLDESLVSNDYFAENGFSEEIIEILAGKKETLYVTERITNHYPEFREGYKEEIENAITN